MKQLPDKTTKPLTPKQLAYCQARAAGFTQAAAYIKAGYNPGSPLAANKNAFALEQNPSVAQYLSRLREEAFTRDALSLAEKRAMIGRMVRAAPAEVDASSPLAQSYIEEIAPDGTVKRKVVLPDKSRLIEIDNKMAGHNFAERQDNKPVNYFSFIVGLSKPESNPLQQGAKETKARLIE
jgi:hypothetical protein